jgi:hypothetical protein
VDFHRLHIFVNLILSVFVHQDDRAMAWNERAIQLDKDPVLGRLQKDAGNGWVFRSSAGELLPVEHIRRIENMAPPRILTGTSPAHRLHLWGTESLSGVIQSLEGGHLKLGTLGNNPLSVPIAVVQRIVHFQGDAVVLRDDFEQAEWPRQLAGESHRSREQVASGDWSLRITAPGDNLEYRLPDPLPSGWFETRFWDSGELRNSPQWYCEFDFDSKVGIRTLQVILGAAAESYALATPQGPSLPVQRIARRRGWSRLAMRFATDRITILIDDAVLTHRAVGVGSLQAVRIAVRAGDEADANQPKASEWFGCIDDLQIAAGLALVAERQPARDQDDLLLANGDQLFGRIETVSGRDVTVQTEFGSQRVPWSNLHAVHLTPRPAWARLVEGQRARVEFVVSATPPSAAADHDMLEGALREVSDDTISLEHPYLGTVRIARSQIRSIDFLSPGRWLTIDPRFHHFGEQVNVRLQVPHPGGSERSWPFDLDEVPGQAVLVLHVVGMQAASTTSDATKRSPSDELRTYAQINNEMIDPLGLNHLLTLNYRSPARLTVPVPEGILKKGNNVLRIYQTPRKDDPRSFDDCGIFGITLHWNAK